MAVLAMLEHLERRRRGSEHDRQPQVIGTSNCEITGRVTQALLLLEGMIVLFVHDNEPELRHRRKDGGARADNKARIAAARKTPGIQTLQIGESGMKQRRLYP